MAAGMRLRLKPKGEKMDLQSTGASSSQGLGMAGTAGTSLGLSYVQIPQTSISNLREALSSPFDDEHDPSPTDYRPSPLSPTGAPGRRRSSKGMTASVVKRSASTPNVRGLATAEAAGLAISAAEKRRNKLGYHRTSVACGHCRRRKIRCCLATEDPQGRCTNCIRLKKECNFFPVDQQPHLDRRPRADSKVEENSRHSGDGPNSASSSPATVVARATASAEDFGPYPSLPLNQVQDVGTPTEPLSADTASPIGKGWRCPVESTFRRPNLAHIHTAPSAPRPFDFAQGAERTPNWNHSPFIERSSAIGPEHHQTADPSSPFWKFTETSGGNHPQFFHPHHPRVSGGSLSLGRPREEFGWPLPARAMSFGHIENLPSQYPNRQNLSHDYRLEMEDMYPPPLNTNHASMSTMTEPASAPAITLPLHPFGPSPTWTSFSGSHLSGMVRKSPEGFNGWYNEPSPLAQVREEDGATHFGGSVATFYPSNGG